MRKERCEGIDTVDACLTGEVPKLSIDNIKFKSLLYRTLPGLFDGFGGVNFLSIDYVMNLCEVSPGQRPIVHDKILQVIAAIEDIRKEEKP